MQSKQEEEWARELARRQKIQNTNQEYIDTALREPLEKIMVATLNKMPEEPAQFMRDYISLHYFFERMQLEKQEPDPRAIRRENLRVGDLDDLKEEVKSLEREKYRF